MRELLSSSAPLNNSTAVITALRLAHDVYRDRSAPCSVVPVRGPNTDSIQIHAWRDSATGVVSLELAPTSPGALERQYEDD